jgi:anaphase-promoting complex subunit 2
VELWSAMLGYFVYDTVGAMRIAQFFDMVVDWPDSLPALRDVKECLAHTNLQPHFITSFRIATQQRLLHAGMSLLPLICSPLVCPFRLRDLLLYFWHRGMQ